MWTAESSLDQLNQNRSQLRNMGVVELGLFGSYACGHQTDNSDMDFLVKLQKNTFNTYMQVWNYLEDLFDRKVDLVIEGSLKESIKPHVLDEVIYVR